MGLPPISPPKPVNQPRIPPNTHLVSTDIAVPSYCGLDNEISIPTNEADLNLDVDKPHKSLKSYAEAVIKSSTKNPKKAKPANTAPSGIQEVLSRVSQLEKLVKEGISSISQKTTESKLPSRDRCLIIVNAPESPKDTSAERILDDELFLRKMVSSLFDPGEEGIKVVNAFRLGRKTEDTARPRPLKLILQSPEECKRVLKRTYRLKGEPYFVLKDLSPEDRVRMREAVTTLKTRRANGETDLHIVDFRVVQKRPRVVWKPVQLRPEAGDQRD